MPLASLFRIVQSQEQDLLNLNRPEQFLFVSVQHAEQLLLL